MRMSPQIVGVVLLTCCQTGLLAQEPREPTPPSEHSASAHEATMAPMRLAPSTKSAAESPPSAGGGAGSLVAVGGSLLLVVGLFLLVAWVFRRASPGATGLLPVEAFEVLGRAWLANRQQVQLIRCGSKLILVTVGSSGVAPLTEITDTAEVERIASLCRHSRPAGASAIRRIFQKMEKTHG
jgi:flagellar biogenesis protein FliO